MVRIKFLNKDDNKFEYLIENGDFTELNSIRRILGYLLPIYAIEDIDFYVNDSVVIDEMLANRIALCPIKTPLVNTGKKVSFKLDEEGEKTVYSKDLISSDKDIKMVYDTIPLTKLNENEKVKLEAYAMLGCGKDHIKYSPAIISYSKLYNLEMPRGCEECKTIFDKCKANSVKVEGNREVLLNPKDYDLCVFQSENCTKKCLKLNETGNYVFSVELIGQTKIKELYKIAERHLKEYFSVLKKKIK